MTTVAEKQADLATLIDDIASTLTALGDWSDADADVVNDGSDNQWHNNGRVLTHANTTTYLLMYVSTGEFNDAGTNNNNVTGIRVVHSSDWDATNNLPAGDTTVDEEDPFSGSVTNHRTDTFTNLQMTDEDAVHGLWTIGRNTSFTDRSSARTASCTYFISGRNDGLTVGAWNTTNGSSGGATAFVWEYSDNKFWNDGHVPVTMTTWQNLYTIANSPQWVANASYAFQAYREARNGYNGVTIPNGMIGIAGNESCVYVGDWGFINPDANDDTFFFRRPVVYPNNSPDNATPVCHIEDAIPNDPNGGGAHGDTVDYGGNTYRVINQTGAGAPDPVSMGLRYE